MRERTGQVGCRRGQRYLQALESKRSVSAALASYNLDSSA
jgi:hypothetical protein